MAFAVACKRNRAPVCCGHMYSFVLLEFVLRFFWGGGGSAVFSCAPDSGEAELEVINVFSLASGHLYERFLKIMMLSVLKNTQNPVKFWFLENVMSPQMKAFLPYMAEKYGFQYELGEVLLCACASFP